MAVSTCKISPALDDRNRARLEAKNYARAYTDVPNRALPETYQKGLGAIFTALTGDDFTGEDSTFTVLADANGVFKRLYAPTVFSTEEQGLVIRWGDRDIPLQLSPGKITVSGAPKGTKFAFKEETIGKYTEPVLSVSVSADGTLYTLPIPIRSADYEDKVSADLLDVLLDENPESIAEKVQVASDLSKRGQSSGSGERMQGPFVKVAHLPIGEYVVTTYRVREGGQYGTDYFLQVKVDDPFTAPVRTQVDGEWVDVETEVQDWCICKPNNALKKLIEADPVIDRENPATLRVLSHDEYNGFPTAKVALKCASFVEDVESFSLDF
jgi:hypothetical protein